mmetsp:Transcript_1827/g.3271  ORF Transcript_1827/g.3271 Transcript_1827/m.3271 type:complete len:407 (-) Transcript_1827:243-1463(-)
MPSECDEKILIDDEGSVNINVNNAAVQLENMTITNEVESDSQCEKINKAIQRLNFNLERSKLLLAHEECTRLHDLLAFTSTNDHNSAECALSSECPVISAERKQSLEELFVKLEKQAKEINDVMTHCHEFSHSGATGEGDDHLDTENDGGWVLGADMFGVKTYYHNDEDDGLISLRMEAEQDVPVFEQMAVLNEAELYSEWIPFCSSSKLVKKISHTEQVFHCHFITPVALRDMLVHVYASDCVMEHGCVAFVGRSLSDEETKRDPDTEWPAHPNYFLGQRMEILQLSGVLRMTSNKSAKSIILMKVNPKVLLPQMVINFLIKKMAGVFLYFLQKKAIALSEETEMSSKHAERMHSNTEFYVDWLLPVVRAYCQHKGWAQFSVNLLGDAGQPEEGRDYCMPEVMFA